METTPPDNLPEAPAPEPETWLSSAEIRATGSQEDLEKKIVPALRQRFQVDTVSKLYPQRDNPQRFDVYLKISGILPEQKD